ncbi:MAG: CheR family methyltransferase [Desulfonatronovibrionaceae bacterium]
MSPLSSQSLSLRKVPPLTGQEFSNLRRLIYELSGIDIPERRKYLLENRLGSRLRALNLRSFSEYFNYLKRAADKRDELNHLFEKITTNETSFFRDIKQLGVFRTFALANILNEQKKAGKKDLYIWCAGCSSGEEAYTLSILIHESLGMNTAAWDIRITANDISPAMIAKAKKGIFNDYSLRNTPRQMLDKYFQKVPEGYKIDPGIQAVVDFRVLNLKNTPEMKKILGSHIIFCRNVIIYFDDAMKQQVINQFYDNLQPEGYLVIGHSESLHKFSRLFRPVSRPGGIMYQKAR